MCFVSIEFIDCEWFRLLVFSSMLIVDHSGKKKSNLQARDFILINSIDFFCHWKVKHVKRKSNLCSQGAHISFNLLILNINSNLILVDTFVL